MRRNDTAITEKTTLFDKSKQGGRTPLFISIAAVSMSLEMSNRIISFTPFAVSRSHRERPDIFGGTGGLLVTTVGAVNKQSRCANGGFVEASGAETEGASGIFGQRFDKTRGLSKKSVVFLRKHGDSR
jgi:hypothetical protein